MILVAVFSSFTTLQIFYTTFSDTIFELPALMKFTNAITVVLTSLVLKKWFSKSSDSGQLTYRIIFSYFGPNTDISPD